VTWSTHPLASVGSILRRARKAWRMLQSKGGCREQGLQSAAFHPSDVDAGKISHEDLFAR